jgi:hypothetical protein
MRKRFVRVLFAFVVALAAAIPAGVRAMPTLAGAASMATQEHCPNCPEHSKPSPNPDTMPACQALTCVGTVAMLPIPVLLTPRSPLQVAYSAGS